MRPARQSALFLACAIVALVLLMPMAGAQAWPDRPVRMLIAFPAGGTIDTLGRILAQKLTETWGQNVVIENRPGGAAISALQPRRARRLTATRSISALRVSR